MRAQRLCIKTANFVKLSTITTSQGNNHLGRSFQQELLTMSLLHSRSAPLTGPWTYVLIVVTLSMGFGASLGGPSTLRGVPRTERSDLPVSAPDDMPPELGNITGSTYMLELFRKLSNSQEQEWTNTLAGVNRIKSFSFVKNRKC